MIRRRNRHGEVLHGQVDWWAIGAYLLLVVLGWLNLYAAVYDPNAAGFEFGSRYGVQMVWIGVSLILGLVIMLVDDKYYHIGAYPVYGFFLLLMVVALFFPPVKGARAWIPLGPFALQPAEFMKFGMSLALARLVSNYGFSLSKPRDFWRSVGVLAVPVGVMFLQHDVGSAVVYASFLFMLYREGLNRWIYIVLGVVLALFFGSFWLTETGMLMLILVGVAATFGVKNHNWKAPAVYLSAVVGSSLAVWLAVKLAAGVEWRYYYFLLVASLVSLPVAWWVSYSRRVRGVLFYIAFFAASVAFVSVADVVFDNLDLHQQKRILDTLGIESDARGWGYNVNQSKIAIGSGGFVGKGFLDGTQTKFNFVPEQSTDFIFCTVGEEWGFLGSLVVLALFCVLIFRLVKMGERSGEPFRRVFCYSVAGIFLIHVLINVGMTIGVVPVIGIPLPFFSYGGSSFLSFTVLVFVALRLDLGSGDLKTD